MALLPLLISHGTSSTSSVRQEKEMNHCEPSIWISCQWCDTLHPDTELGNLLVVSCQAKGKKNDMHHCYTYTQSRSFSEWFLHLIWLQEFVIVEADLMPVLQSFRNHQTCMDCKSLWHQEATTVFWLPLYCLSVSYFQSLACLLSADGEISCRKSKSGLTKIWKHVR